MFTAADKILDCVGPLITVVISETSPAWKSRDSRHEEHSRRFVFTERDRRDRERIQGSEFRGTLKCPQSPQGVKARNFPIGTVNSNDCITLYYTYSIIVESKWYNHRNGGNLRMSIFVWLNLITRHGRPVQFRFLIVRLLRAVGDLYGDLSALMVNK